METLIGVVVFLVLMGVIGLVVYMAVQKISSVQKEQSANQTYAIRASLDAQQQVQSLPSDKQIYYFFEYNNRKKDKTVALLLAILVGGIGAHKFYMGDNKTGVLYLIFCWTYIPTLLGWIDAASIGSKVAAYNTSLAQMILASLQEDDYRDPMSYDPSVYKTGGYDKTMRL